MHILTMNLSIPTADGLIISSPTGSTGYSKLCVSIVLPGTNNFIITPIAPHNLNVRPIIISDESKITLKVSESSDELALVLQIAALGYFRSRIRIIHSSADYKVKLIQFEKQSFISTIKRKTNVG